MPIISNFPGAATSTDDIVTALGGAAIELNGAFGNAPHTIVITDEEEPPLTAKDVVCSDGKTVQEKVTELFTSVGDGKQVIASAITDKGVTTAQDATFEQMAENIGQITTGPENVCTIDVQPNNPDYGDVTGGGVASSGMKLTLTASPADKYRLKCWKSNSNELGTKNEYTFTVSKDETIVAEFEEGNIVGRDWKLTALPTIANLCSVAYGDGKFVAIGSKGIGAYSEDGKNWTIVDLPCENCSDLVFGNDIFVALVSGSSSGTSYGAGAIYSKNGINWSSTDLVTNNWNSITYGNGKFVAVSTNRKCAYSEDGRSWEYSNLPDKNDYAWNVTAGNGCFVAVGGAYGPYYSVDGITWLKYRKDTPMKDIAYGNGIFIGVGYSGIISSNGIDWDDLYIESDRDAIIYADNKFVCWENSLYDTDKLYFSTDGATWSDMAKLPAKRNWKSIAYGNGIWVAVEPIYNYIAYSSSN